MPPRATSSGYVQFVDSTSALPIAKEHDLVVRYAVRSGFFVVKDEDIGNVRTANGETPADEVMNEVAITVALDPRRTQAQGAEFELNALVEIALRALSPGINDPYTATACIDQVTSALAHHLKGRVRADFIRDDDEVIRIHRFPQSFHYFLDTVFIRSEPTGSGNCRCVTS